MENKNKPAYPVRGANNAPINMNDGFPWEKMSIGLTKRELIAAMMAQGMLSNPDGCMTSGSSRSLNPHSIAQNAVNQADILLELLNKLETE